MKKPLPLVLFHGARRWEGPPEVRHGRAKRTEHGPGIYLTTNEETARRYAKGGGRVLRFELDPATTVIEGHTIDFREMVRFLEDTPHIRSRKKIIEDVYRAHQRTLRDQLPAETLVNLMVNHDALTGAASPALARFLVDRGIDSIVTSPSFGGDEIWVVLMNADRVRHVTDLTSSRKGR